MIEFLEGQWVQRVGFVVGGVLAGVVVELVVVRRAHQFALKTSAKWDDLIIASIRGVPTIWFGVRTGYRRAGTDVVENST